MGRRFCRCSRCLELWWGGFGGFGVERSWTNIEFLRMQKQLNPKKRKKKKLITYISFYFNTAHRKHPLADCITRLALLSPLWFNSTSTRGFFFFFYPSTTKEYNRMCVCVCLDSACGEDDGFCRQPRREGEWCQIC